MKKIKIVSILAVILSMFTVLLACDKGPSNASELLEKTVEACKGIEQYSANITSTSGSELIEDLTVEVNLDPIAYEYYDNEVGGSKVLFADGKLYEANGELREVTELGENGLGIMEEMAKLGVDYSKLEPLILKDSLAFEEYEGSYTLYFDLDTFAIRDYVNSNMNPTVSEELAAVGIVLGEASILSKWSYTLEIDSETYLPYSYAVNIMLVPDASGAEATINVSNIDYETAVEIIAPQDSDGDNLYDVEEIEDYDTDPSKADTDGDGVNDGVVTGNGLVPGTNMASDGFFVHDGTYTVTTTADVCDVYWFDDDLEEHRYVVSKDEPIEITVNGSSGGDNVSYELPEGETVTLTPSLY